MGAKRKGLAIIFCLALLTICVYPHISDYNKAFLPVWDSADHYTASVYQHNLIFDRANPLRTFWINELSHYYPPLVHIYTSFWYLFMPTSPLTASASLLPMLFGLIVITYLLGKRWFAASSGFLAALLLFFSTSALEWTRAYSLDLPLAFFCVLTVYLGERFKKSGKLTDSLLLYLSIAFGLLVKWTFIIFIWGILLFYLIETVLAKDWKKLAAYLFGLLLALALICPWYVKYGSEIFRALAWTGLKTSASENFRESVLLHSPAPFSFQALTYYFKVLTNYEWGYALFALLLVGFAAFLSRNIKRREFWLAFVWFFSAFLVLFILTNKQPRYFLPAIPSIALLLISWIGSVRSKPFKYCAATFLFALCLFKPYATPFPEDEFKPKPLVFNMPSGSEKDKKFSELTKKIVSDIKQDLKEGFRLHLLVLPDFSRFNSHTFYAEAIAQGIETNIALTDWMRSEPDWYQNLDYAQYVIIKDGEQGTSDTTKHNDVFRSRLLENKKLTLWKTYQLPDETSAYLYRKESSQVLADTQATPIAILDGKIKLIEARFEIVNINEKRVLSAEYVWVCAEKVEENYKIFVHFDSEKLKFNQDHYPLWGWYPTSAWKSGDAFREYYTFPIPDNAHGRFDIYIGAFREDTGEVLGDKKIHVGSIYIDGEDDNK